MNPKFEVIKAVLMKSYDGLPYYLKSCFLYLSIFPEDLNVSRRRLVCRWIAEGYSWDKSIADKYFIELIERSMILPTQQSILSRQVFDSCQLHDLIRDISIAKSMEENLVFRLEEGCNSNTRGTVRHLSISSNWEGDERELENTVELSRIRSLTVFGNWRPFYISEKMRFLRVLDLESTEGLADHHLEHIGKHIHLRYLSLRRCEGVFYLPNSVGDLRQLETLDIKFTRIFMLPETITKLSKLCFLHAGNVFCDQEEWPAPPCCISAPIRFSWSRGGCSPYMWYKKHGARPFSLKVPRGIGKLKNLQALGCLDLERGNAVIEEIKALTSLRKLRVSFGIRTENVPEFCSAISCLRRLESLTLESWGENLYDYLNGMSSPPENLQSLKLSGYVEKLPEWIKGHQNLMKLKLQRTNLSSNCEIMQVLGNLPNLSILLLEDEAIQIEGTITFQSDLFRNLRVLELYYLSMEIVSLKFEETSMPKLELLRLELINCTAGLAGLQLLPSIKEMRLSIGVYPDGSITEELAQKVTNCRTKKTKEDIREQFANNKNKPILKVE
uniref:NB-ARC domain-containing protein n=2 Tax=Hordeum vulgare subsp. vulgare TaxID=112509 RepID=A0A8I7BHV8_HORVV